MIAKVRNQTLDSFAGLGVVTHDTMAEYEALSEEEKMDGNVHLVLEEEPINANIVEYTDGKTVKDELDDIAEKTGNTDISAIGDGTTTGAIGSLNTQLTTNLLWTNPSPTSAFAGQTISLDLSKVNKVLIQMYSTIDENYLYSSEIVKDTSSDIFCGDVYWFRSRRVTVTDTGVTFANGKNAAYGSLNSNVGENNTAAIPYKIFAI